MPVDTKQLESGVAVVALSGRLVLGKDLDKMETAVKDLVEAGQKRIVFDLSTLDYADSAGIGTMVSCLTHIKKAQGELRVAGANARVARLFKLTGIDRLLAMYASVSEAAA